MWKANQDEEVQYNQGSLEIIHESNLKNLNSVPSNLSKWEISSLKSPYITNGLESVHNQLIFPKIHAYKCVRRITYKDKKKLQFIGIISSLYKP